MRNGIRAAVLAAALATGIAVPAVTASAGMQLGGGVNGYTIRAVIHSGGSFRQGQGKNWAEYDVMGRVTYRFVETQRDDWSIYLFDASRNVRVQLDAFRKKIRYADAGRDYADMYDVTGVSNESNYAVPVPQPPLAGGARYNVDAGPIWDNNDARTKCGRVAVAVRGSWTGQWSTLVPNQHSVCEIQF